MKQICLWMTIYVYVLLYSERLFRCITTPPCGLTRWMLQVGIEIHLTLRWTEKLPLRYFDDQRKLGNSTHFLLTFVCLHFMLLDTGVLRCFCMTQAFWYSCHLIFLNAFQRRWSQTIVWLLLGRIPVLFNQKDQISLSSQYRPMLNFVHVDITFSRGDIVTEVYDVVYEF